MKLITIALMMFLITSVVFAQEDTPWPPDPSAIFPPGIEVVSVELVANDEPPPAPVEQSVPIMERRAVVMPDGRVFPWLDEFPYASFYLDPDIIVNESLFIAVSSEPQGEIDTTWRLDLKTGTYTPLSGDPVDTVCGPLHVSQISKGWIWLASRQYCEMATGEKTIPLPEDLIRLTDIYSQTTQPIPSPDGQMLLILGKQADSEADFMAYRYDVADESFEALGAFAQGKFLDFTGWAGNRVAILNVRGNRSGDVYPEFYGYVALDLEKGDVRQWSAFVSPMEPPTSITYRADETPTITTREPINADQPDQSCHITRDDILARTTSSYEFPSACRPEYSVQVYDYYRDISSDQTQATLFKVDRLTGNRTDIKKGEIEFVTWVSPDERYMALILDDSGKIDTPPAQFSAESYLEHARLNLIDMETDKVWLEVPAYRDSFSGGWSPFVRRVIGNWIQVIHPWGGETLNNLIYLDGNDTTVHPLDGVLSAYLGNSWLVLRPRQVENEYGGVASLGLYNLDTQKTISILNIGDHYQYYLPEDKFKPLGGDQFQITVGYDDIGSDQQPEKPIAQYTIRIPGVDIPAQP